MDTLVSNAVHDVLSSPSFFLRFPTLSDRTWDTTFACTRHELDAKRSNGLLALYSFLERALIRVTERRDCPLDLESLREILLSDNILALFLVNAGVHESYAGQDSEVGRAFLVFVEMVIMDRGVQEFGTWFAHMFHPIVSKAFEACGSCQHDLAVRSPSKRALQRENGGASKRRRTGMDASGSRTHPSALTVLHRLRQRQTLSTSNKSTSEIHVSLGAATSNIPTEPNVWRISVKEGVQESTLISRDSSPLSSPLSSSPVTFSAGDDPNPGQQTCIPETQSMQEMAKWCQENPTALFLEAIYTARSETTSPMSPAPLPNAAPPAPPISTTSPESFHPPLVASIFSVGDPLDDPTVMKSLEEAADRFIRETIAMVGRGEILPTPVLNAKLEPHSGKKKMANFAVSGLSKRPTDGYKGLPSEKKHLNKKPTIAKENLGMSNKKTKRRKANLPLTGGALVLPSVRSESQLGLFSDR
ncbi:hypothetical protein B0H11DRAFT_2067689 [Mycena galericulata]|nr:hypothetical protein B0H11DRAFT_2067689 [Mycena galericulata]